MSAEIPEQLQQFARELAMLADKHGLRFIDGKFAKLGCDWSNDVHFRWDAGRHGAEADRISIYSTITVSVRTTVGKTPSQQGESK